MPERNAQPESDGPRKPNKLEAGIRRDEHGIIKMMAMKDGYVMCRRPGAMPFVMAVKDWDALLVQEMEKRFG